MERHGLPYVLVSVVHKCRPPPSLPRPGLIPQSALHEPTSLTDEGQNRTSTVPDLRLSVRLILVFSPSRFPSTRYARPPNAPRSPPPCILPQHAGIRPRILYHPNNGSSSGNYVKLIGNGPTSSRSHRPTTTSCQTTKALPRNLNAPSHLWQVDDGSHARRPNRLTYPPKHLRKCIRTSPCFGHEFLITICKAQVSHMPTYIPISTRITIPALPRREKHTAQQSAAEATSLGDLSANNTSYVSKHQTCLI